MGCSVQGQAAAMVAWLGLCPLRPVIPKNTCPPRLTTAAGTELAGASSSSPVMIAHLTKELSAEARGHRVAMAGRGSSSARGGAARTRRRRGGDLRRPWRRLCSFSGGADLVEARRGSIGRRARATSVDSTRSQSPLDLEDGGRSASIAEMIPGAAAALPCSKSS